MSVEIKSKDTISSASLLPEDLQNLPSFEGWLLDNLPIKKEMLTPQIYLSLLDDILKQNENSPHYSIFMQLINALQAKIESKNDL